MIGNFHIMDSGSHTWTNKMFGHRTKSKKRKGKPDWSMYDSDEFWKYVDDYAKFVKKYKRYIDHYVSVDVIRNPKRSWEVQQYLEKEHGLKPMPVFHFNTPLKWIDHYLDRGYDYIGMGGPVGKVPYAPWADRAWDRICSTPKRLPAAKIHGFAVTTHKHIVRYPWYSVDSVTWKKMAYYSQILPPPPKSGGGFRFDVPNLVVFVDSTSPYTNRGNGKGRHFLHYSKLEQKAILDWLDFIHVPFGSKNKDGSIKVEGVTNSNFCRVEANLNYFKHLSEAQPKWPWPFHVRIHPTLSELLK